MDAEGRLSGVRRLGMRGLAHANILIGNRQASCRAQERCATRANQYGAGCSGNQFGLWRCGFRARRSDLPFRAARIARESDQGRGAGDRHGVVSPVAVSQIDGYHAGASAMRAAAVAVQDAAPASAGPSALRAERDRPSRNGAAIERIGPAEIGEPEEKKGKMTASASSVTSRSRGIVAVRSSAESWLIREPFLVDQASCRSRNPFRRERKDNFTSQSWQGFPIAGSQKMI